MINSLLLSAFVILNKNARVSFSLTSSGDDKTAINGAIEAIPATSKIPDNKMPKKIKTKCLRSSFVNRINKFSLICFIILVVSSPS